MPNLYKELHDKHQAEINAFPFGFAFSQKQFDQMMVERFNFTPTDTDKIYSIGGGGYIRKEDHQAMRDMFERHAKEKKNAIAADLTGDGYIYDMFVYELTNHEYMITMTSDDTLDALGLTWEDVKADTRLSHGLKKAKKYIIEKSHNNMV
jgi:hypothetical protein